MPVRCGVCWCELPLEPGPFTTCPRCVPDPEVAGRIAAELLEAALARPDADMALQLLATAEAWRSSMRAAVADERATSHA